ncbi:MAG: hypothetical protein Q7S58_17250 [Candidatus Binatus sp.]|uniref:YncE family protein n=1 Tax=Candidatus Binatus sp. TaxID=2811406 RepID=UPI0027282561|nr:hypothetical protein [Candidatus Binatus sp.]MDO8434148.1 hypothetical protein [Candidatus Binatus sp.]
MSDKGVRNLSLRFLVLTLVALCSTTSGHLARAAYSSQIYRLTGSIKIGGDGGWDYLALSPNGHALYVTRTTHTMVIDLATGQSTADIRGLRIAHGVVLVPDAGRGFVSDGGAGTVVVFDLNTGAELGRVAAADDADAIIYDPASKRVLVFCGDAHQMVAIAPDVDPKRGKAIAKVDLGGTPEYGVADGRGEIFVNIVDRDELAVIDSAAMKVIARWPTGAGKQPTALAIDPKTRRLFIGCRNGRLIVMNADTGVIVADFPIGQGVDGVAFIDGLILASCFDGTMSVFREIAADKFVPMQTVSTAVGARTLTVDPSSGTVYLPTAEMKTAGGHRYEQAPGTFKILVLTRTAEKNP